MPIQDHLFQKTKKGVRPDSFHSVSIMLHKTRQEQYQRGTGQHPSWIWTQNSSTRHQQAESSNLWKGQYITSKEGSSRGVRLAQYWKVNPCNLPSRQSKEGTPHEHINQFKKKERTWKSSVSVHEGSRIEGNFYILIRDTYKNPTVHLTLSGLRLNAPPRPRTKQSCPLSSPHFNTVLESQPVQNTRRGHQRHTTRQRAKLTKFIDNRISM